MKPQGKKSLNIPSDIHKRIKLRAAEADKEMSELMAEAWKTYENSGFSSIPDLTGKSAEIVLHSPEDAPTLAHGPDQGASIERLLATAKQSGNPVALGLANAILQLTAVLRDSVQDDRSGSSGVEPMRTAGERGDADSTGAAGRPRPTKKRA